MSNVYIIICFLCEIFGKVICVLFFIMFAALVVDSCIVIIT